MAIISCHHGIAYGCGWRRNIFAGGDVGFWGHVGYYDSNNFNKSYSFGYYTYTSTSRKFLGRVIIINQNLISLLMAFSHEMP